MIPIFAAVAGLFGKRSPVMEAITGKRETGSDFKVSPGSITYVEPACTCSSAERRHRLDEEDRRRREEDDAFDAALAIGIASSISSSLTSDSGSSFDSSDSGSSGFDSGGFDGGGGMSGGGGASGDW